MPRGLHIVEDWAGGMFVLWPALKFVSERIGSWFPAVGSVESGLDPNGAGVTAAGYTDVRSDGLVRTFGMFVFGMSDLHASGWRSWSRPCSSTVRRWNGTAIQNRSTCSTVVFHTGW